MVLKKNQLQLKGLGRKCRKGFVLDESHLAVDCRVAMVVCENAVLHYSSTLLLDC